MLAVRILKGWQDQVCSERGDNVLNPEKPVQAKLQTMGIRPASVVQDCAPKMNINWPLDFWRQQLSFKLKIKEAMS